MLAIMRMALSRPYTFAVMAILIAIFGGVAAVRTPTDIFPNIGIPVISVIWSYGGLPADDMAGRIVSPFERSLSTTVNDIEHIESQSLSGYGVIKIYFQPNVNINAAQAQVTSISQTILKQLPAGITPPQILSFNASSVPIIQLVLSSNTLSQTKLNDLATNFIRPQLATIAGAALPSPYGGTVRQLQIDLDQRALHAYGLSAQDIVTALAAQNLITPVGTEKIGKFEFTINLNDSPKKIEDFNNLPIKHVDGSVVYLRDVAFAHDGNPPQTNVVMMDGRKGVLMTVMKAGSASTLDIIAGVKAILPSIETTLPIGVDIALVGDQSSFVMSAVKDVIREGVIAACLTALMILVFLGSWRSTLIITISIPLAILASLTILSSIGQTINVMTLGGLALAVGILVDDATVTIENINWHLEHGKSVKSAVLDGAEQIVAPATVSLLCICVAFAPMFWLGGVGGYLFRPLAEAVVFAMIASYVLSRTLVPTMANLLLNHTTKHSPSPRLSNPAGMIVWFQREFERKFETLRAGYLRLLRLALKRRLAFLAVFASVIASSFILAPFLGQDFFPTPETNAIKLHIRAQTGTRVEETTRLSSAIEKAIHEIIPPNRLTSIVTNIGMPISGTNISYGNSGTIGVEDADLMISLNGDSATALYEKRLREELPKAFPEATFSFLPADIVTQILNFGIPAPIDVQIVGTDLDATRKFANRLLGKIRHVPGIADPRIQEAFEGPALRVRFDRTLAGLVGLTERDAASSLQDTLASSSQIAPTYWVNPENGVSYPVAIQTPQYDMDTLEALNNLPLAAGGSTQLLGGLATISPEPVNAIVSHYNIRPTINIYATMQERDLGAIVADIQTIVDDSRINLPRGDSIIIRGQPVTMAKAYNQLYSGLAFAIILIYLLIVINFQSWLDPFVIVAVLPFALAGIVWILFVTHTTLSVPALTGAIMCMGVGTANSILVMSFAREQLASGKDALTAALAAGAARFRPVLMTALAMIIGMAPMAMGAGQNAPLGRAVIGGLIFATFATLFFVPTVFSILYGREVRPAEPCASEATDNDQEGQ
ncbi:efflux RND transporter permease subunit [Methylocapsa palsarum]|uniref:Multidrug efflux pump subunit AcrB n=1 Tax=Methylocapsa palsarum TaxID=1612308 RepID=A0A1I4B0H6_9HYPH|nr:efflux RND transporter permease subunit [Methylocapsa palsarum]SFK61591.1 Multidrug efflux pump subunit AcrB [Methylocapsa palsarum]